MRALSKRLKKVKQEVEALLLETTHKKNCSVGEDFIFYARNCNYLSKSISDIEQIQERISFIISDLAATKLHLRRKKGNE